MLAACVAIEKVSAGVVVAVATEVVTMVPMLPALKLVTVPVPAGKSAVTRARKDGAAAAPVVGPANAVFAVCVFNANVKAGVVVGVATDVVNNGLRFPEEKDVTVPEVAGAAHTGTPPATVKTFPVAPIGNRAAVGVAFS
jgi:predicted RecA/RadA family phage recombinase